MILERYRAGSGKSLRRWKCRCRRAHPYIAPGVGRYRAAIMPISVGGKMTSANQQVCSTNFVGRCRNVSGIETAPNELSIYPWLFNGDRRW